MATQFLFSSVQSHEFLIYSTSTANIGTTPFLTRMINHFNKVANWCSSIILLNPSERVKRAKFLAKVAIECLSHNNFFTAFSIHSSFQSTEIYNLLNNKLVKAKPKIEILFNSVKDLKNNNHSIYRSILQKLFFNGSPCIPYLGLHLQDFLYLTDQLGDKISRGEINFSSFEKISDMMFIFHSFQNRSFNFPEHKSYSYLYYISGFDKDILNLWSDDIKNDRFSSDNFPYSEPPLSDSTPLWLESSLRERIEFEASCVPLKFRSKLWYFFFLLLLLLFSYCLFFIYLFFILFSVLIIFFIFIFIIFFKFFILFYFILFK